MTRPSDLDGSRRSGGYLLLYALAWGGGVIAYAPLLSLLLPLRITELGLADKVGVVSLVTVVGAVTASVMNVLVGWLSDRWSHARLGRRPWVLAGLIATALSYVVIGATRTMVDVVLGVILFQAALNLMLAPLAALAADEVPDAQKGTLGGLMGATYPMGSLAGVVVTAPMLGDASRLILAFGLAAAAILPFLLLAGPGRGRLADGEATTQGRAEGGAQGLRNLVFVWLARLLIQVAGAVLFAYLLYYFETVTVDGGLLSARDMAARVAWLSGLAAAATVPLSIAMGRLSDRLGARRRILQGLAGANVAGLLLMGLWPSWPAAAAGYGLFAVATAIFLALQQTYVMRLLPSPRNRGRDLGVLNLTNTLPSIAGPGLAYAVISTGGYRPLFLLLAVLCAGAGALMGLVRER